MRMRVVGTMMIFIMLILVLMACESSLPTGTGRTIVHPTWTPSNFSGFNSDPAYSAAEATLVAGQGYMIELAHQATMVSLNMNQAASAAAQTTADYHQSQLVELAYQATAIRLEMEQAAAAQHLINEQTQAAWYVMATGQSRAVTATHSANLAHFIGTAQIQEILDVQATQTAEARATQTAYVLTATPEAAIQAYIARTRNEAERRALWGEFVVTPVKLILYTLPFLLLLVGGVLAYQRLMPVIELRLRTVSRYDNSSMLLVDGKLVDCDPPQPRLEPRGELSQNHPYRFLNEEPPIVEIAGPSEASVTNWITEAEQELFTRGGTQA